MTAKRQKINNDNKGIVYCTPQDDLVELPKIHLSDQFRKYKEAIIATRISISDIAAVLSLWLPILTVSEFKSILWISSDMLKGGYYCIAIFATFIILKPIYILCKRFFDTNEAKKYETDPEIRVKNIIEGQATPEGVRKTEYFREMHNDLLAEKIMKLYATKIDSI